MKIKKVEIRDYKSFYGKNESMLMVKTCLSTEKMVVVKAHFIMP